MPHLRIMVDLSIPLHGEEGDPVELRVPMQLLAAPEPAELAGLHWFGVLGTVLKKVSAFAEAPAGDVGPQPTVTAHICRHDQGLPCEETIDFTLGGKK